MAEGYWIQSGKVYWHTKTVKGANPDTLEVFNDTWARDGKRVFSQGSIMRNVDAASFMVLNHLFAKDSSAVYYLGGVVKTADPAGFEVLDAGRYEEHPGDYVHAGFARDDKNVFHYVATIGKPSIVRGAKVADFRVIKYDYATDGKAIFNGLSRAKKADPDTFEVLSPHFARDAARVYYVDERVPGAERESFRVIAGMLAADRDHVFYGTEVVDGADPVSLVVVGPDDYFSKDGQNIYAHGERFDAADASSFVHVGGCYYRDRARVFYLDRVLEGADPETFEALPKGMAQDHESVYRGPVRIRDRSAQ